MIQFPRLERQSTIGRCPVCGTSWCGPTFLYIYKTALKRMNEPYKITELARYVNKRHELKNQSRLLYDELSKEYVCPDCETRFQIKDE